MPVAMSILNVNDNVNAKQRRGANDDGDELPSPLTPAQPKGPPHGVREPVGRVEAPEEGAS